MAISRSVKFELTYKIKTYDNQRFLNNKRYKKYFNNWKIFKISCKILHSWIFRTMYDILSSCQLWKSFNISSLQTLLLLFCIVGIFNILNAGKFELFKLLLRGFHCLAYVFQCCLFHSRSKPHWSFGIRRQRLYAMHKRGCKCNVWCT